MRVPNFLKLRFPVWFTLLLIAMFTSWTALVIAENATDLFMMKPSILRIKSAPPSVKILGVSFSENLTTSRWMSGNVDVINTADIEQYGLVSINVYDADAREIAWGATNSTLLQPDIEDYITVEINWLAGAYIEDYSMLKIEFLPKQPPTPPGG